MAAPAPATATPVTAVTPQVVPTTAAAVQGVPPANPNQQPPVSQAKLAAGAGANPNFTSASLYVGDLLADVTEALLFEIFNAVGPVASIRVCRDAVTRKSLGYAYVNFHNVVDAERALDTMNFTMIRSNPCRIMWSQRDPSVRKSGIGNIFVKNLDKSIDNKTLYDTFSMFGNILSCKVATSDKGESLGYGFVHYETEQAATKAIEKVNGMVIAAKKVFVAPFRPKAERGGPSVRTFTNCYVKNLPKEFDEEKLNELFAQFGVVTSSMVAMDEENKCKGFAFINFEKPENALECVEKMNDVEFPEGSGNKLVVCRAQKKSERRKELAERHEKAKVERQKQFANVNLYIKNLDDNMDDEGLETAFAPYGSITSAKIMRDDNNRSKGFGFVCYSAPEEATKAIAEMNGKMISNKPLYVAPAQRKEDRRAQLEARMALNRNKQQQQQMPPQGAMQPMYPQGPPMYFPQQGAMRPGQFNLYPQQMGAPRQGGRFPNRPRGRGGKRTGGQRHVANKPMPQQAAAPAQGAVAAPGQQAPAQAAPMTASPVAQPPLGPMEPLTAQALASAPEAQQKQMIGERIFPLVHSKEPELAGKITGMLLEIDNSDLLHLLESPEALHGKIEEALNVLRQHKEAGAAEASA